MGEKIKNLGKFHISNDDVYIELNDGYDKKYSEYDIHIQSECVQYCITNRQFVKLASALINAKKRFDDLKAE